MSRKKVETRSEHRKALEQKRFRRVKLCLSFFKEEMAARLAETRRIFGEPVVIVDPHTHSDYSDGTGTVAANRAAADAAGVDFIFATDHGTLAQKRALRHLAGVSWGQEPGAGPHHVGLLENPRVFRPRGDDFPADFRRARAAAPFAWVPHPAGWYPDHAYREEQVALLWRLGPCFAVEVLNGANKIFSGFDRLNQAAVAAWERLLVDGRRVTALGGSDAHAPEIIGSAWTAVFGCEPAGPPIVGALRAGRCLASEAPLITLSLAGRPPGSVVRAKLGEPLRLAWRAADAAGLQVVRLVTAGRVLVTSLPRGKPLVTGSLTVNAAGDAYYRLEAQAVDGRRAFLTPVYLRPACSIPAGRGQLP